MYQASTVLTGSEIPALKSSGSCAAADRHPARTRARAVAQMRVAREGPFVRMLLPPSFFIRAMLLLTRSFRSVVSAIAVRDHSTPAKPISGDPRELPGNGGFPPAVARTPRRRRQARLLSRFRSSHHCAAHSFANFGIYDSSAVFGFEVPTQTRGYNDRNFKSTALGHVLRCRAVRTAFEGWISGEPHNRARAAGCESASRGCGTRTRPYCPAYRRSSQQGWRPRTHRERRCSC